jgi:hypothetical protein
MAPWYHLKSTEMHISIVSTVDYGHKDDKTSKIREDFVSTVGINPFNEKTIFISSKLNG